MAPGFLCAIYDLQCLLLAQLSGEVLVAGFGGFASPFTQIFFGQTLGGDGLIHGLGAFVPLVHPLAGTVEFLDDLVASGVVPVLEAGAYVLAGLFVADHPVAVKRLALRLWHKKSAAAPAKLHSGLAHDEVQEEEAVVGRRGAEVVAVGEMTVLIHQHGLNKLCLMKRPVLLLEVQGDTAVEVAEKLDGEILKEDDLLQRRDHRMSRLKQMLQRPVVDGNGIVQNGSRQRPMERVVALEGVHEVRESLHHILEGVVVEDLALVEVGDDVVGHGGDVVDDLHIRPEVQLRELNDLLLNR